MKIWNSELVSLSIKIGLFFIFLSFTFAKYRQRKYTLKKDKDVFYILYILHIYVAIIRNNYWIINYLPLLCAAPPCKIRAISIPPVTSFSWSVIPYRNKKKKILVSNKRTKWEDICLWRPSNENSIIVFKCFAFYLVKV